MNYRHKIVVNAPKDKTVIFHQNASNMGKITPPPILVQIKTAPNPIFEGAEMEFTLWFGPIPVRWRARFENVSPAGFIDRQVSGPFKTWVHKHAFKDIGGGKTEILDDVQAELHSSLVKRSFGMLMWIGMPVLFAYRGWRTRRELETLA
ncbi:MAG TPA: hypothetical protein VLA49_15865 [Anaerolineales bacterium]|nr:hypothetical protein [Anaerolineales bacterium]